MEENWDSLPVVLGNDTGESLELPRHDLGRLLSLPLLEVLSNAEDDIDTNLQRSEGLFHVVNIPKWAEGGDRWDTHLGSDELVRLVEDGATLRVAEDDPGEVEVLQLVERDLTSVGTRRELVSVLGSDGNLLRTNNQVSTRVWFKERREAQWSDGRSKNWKLSAMSSDPA
jgi:hypothetical protein